MNTNWKNTENQNHSDRMKLQKLLSFLENRIKEHNRRIDQAIRADNHNMKTIIKAERAEACIIRQKILDELK